ncbi:hypothetical protein VNO78_15377 [Psophocarpus tetragonolobus]|uniref:AAA+ ATPase domain-containing protein n=1 Tax=Psophocarpus tetragonolobus TaxID=3891 RepID=A0AAN9SF87_PSOTE
MIEEIKEGGLFNKKFDKVSYWVGPTIDAALSNIGYENFGSRNKTLEMIMKAVEDCTINMIGVYGVSGVGKTTLVKEVANKVKEKKPFNMVVMASITSNPNIKEIQGQIAEMLGMRLEEESEIVRADRIRKRLKKENDKTLIILDDLWHGLDLNRLGILCSDDDDNQIEKEKLSINFNKMEKEKLSINFKRGYLNCSEFDVQAFEIAKMCAGLPVALVSIGRALKNKSSFELNDVCRQIKSQSFTRGQESVEFSVKLSYDNLKDEQLKHIFLHCARMGNDPLIMDLMKFSIGFGLLQGIHTIREARDRVNVLIQELKESSLLVASYSSNRFNMHDIVRDVALSISSKEKHVLFMKNGILDEWPNEDELERCTAIFLHYCDINDELPDSIYCPRLEVLHIDNKNEFLEIPDNFFKNMIQLRVLVLIGFNLSCLPSSIKYLKKLRMLSLERCTLGSNLSIIGELKKIRVLTLSGSNIESLPLEFGKLDKLQLFYLSNCSKLRVIPSNIISRMKNLEEFYMRDSLILWKNGDNVQNGNASLSELRHLNQLQNLDIHIQSVTYFPQNLFFDMLDSYKIVIGELNMLTMEEFKIPEKYELEKFLALNLKEGIDIHSKTWVKMLFKSVEYLVLGELNDVQDVFYELNVSIPKLERLELSSINILKIWSDQSLHCYQNLLTLKVTDCGDLKYLMSLSVAGSLVNLQCLFVSTCEMMENIFRPEDAKDIDIFPKLKTMEIVCMEKLNTIWQPQCGLNSFHSLDYLIIEECHKLVSIFPSYMGQKFQNLQILTIINSWYNFKFPLLDNLVVSQCPKMTIFSKVNSAPNLKKVHVVPGEKDQWYWESDLNDTLQRHFTNKVCFEYAKLVRLVDYPEMKGVRHGKPAFPDNFFSCLQKLEFDASSKRDIVIPSNVLPYLKNLEELNVDSCGSAEVIFDIADSETKTNGIVFRLKNLTLKGLTNLKCVWNKTPGQVVSFPNLEQVYVEYCGSLVALFPSSIAKNLGKLKTLQINSCAKLVEIVGKEDAM